ncbi:MAG: helix-turn-helix domain-containing protein [Oscillospiraceae bacterium]|jgi:transcriptional regulator with XRE-family HTH domain|nr:helix-turn-helix domain-containing protein [Oscillospiraceae bacterium]
MVKTTLGERLTDLREAKKLTQDEVADALCISRTSMSNYENNKNTEKMSFDTFCKFAAYYEVPVNRLADISDNSYQDDIETFKRYGLSEKFLQGIMFSELVAKHSRGPVLSETLNKIFNSFPYWKPLFENIGLYFTKKTYDTRKVTMYSIIDNLDGCYSEISKKEIK